MILAKEEQVFLRHMEDLQQKSLYAQSEVFSDFLSVRESAILKKHLAALPDGRLFLFGGIEEAERKMACFYPSYIHKEEIQFPITVLHLKVLGAKFQTSLPKHSDFLGAVLGLGIERRLIGDIFVDEKGSSAFLLCSIPISDFILTELKSVGKFKISIEETTPMQISSCRNIEIKSGTVSSIRLDAVVSEVFHLSRSKVKDLFLADKVIVNGSLPTSLHSIVSKEDVISCRGYGKFIFQEEKGKTKKDKIKFSYAIYS